MVCCFPSGLRLVVRAGRCSCVPQAQVQVQVQVQVKSRPGGMCPSKYPYWQEYKDRVQARSRLGGEMKLYFDLGKAVIRVVEDADMVEYADMICMREIEQDPIDWDFNVEDALGESDALGKAVFAVYWWE